MVDVVDSTVTVTVVVEASVPVYGVVDVDGSTEPVTVVVDASVPV